MPNFTYEEWLLGSLILAALVPIFSYTDFIRGFLSGFFGSLLVRGFAFLYTHQSTPPEIQNDMVAALTYAAQQSRDPFLCALGGAVVVGGLRKLWLRRNPQIGLIKVLYFKDYLVRFILIAFGAIPTALGLILGPPLLGNSLISTAKEYYHSVKSQTLTKEILEWAISMRQQLPLRADDKETLIAIAPQGNTVLLNYTLTSLPNRGEETQVLDERKQNAEQSICKKPSMMRILENGGTFLFSYADSNGATIGEFKISEVACK